jgi:hypothetical protein
MNRTPGQVGGAAISGGLIGAAGGAALGSQLDATVLGAVIGAVVLGAGEAVTDATRKKGQPKPLPERIIAGAAVAAAVGWLVALVLPDISLAVWGVIAGVVYGAIGFRIGKIALGAAAGLAVGLLLEAAWPEAGLPWTAALTLVLYRVAAALLYRGSDLIEIMGEQVEAAQLEFVVPFATYSGYVGVDYLKEYADLTGADFVRNPDDIGIVADFDALAGPHFDPEGVNPLIREFYEHTSRFHLSITPEWQTWMKPAYLAYRATIARPLGQANVPFNVQESQRGVVNWIDTIDMEHHGEVAFRAWIRAYQESREPLYVGIYTVLRRDDTGFVSVGFPLPAGNLTATLLPYANRDDGLLLKSHADDPYPGHYLSVIEDTGALTTFKLNNFDEEIDVYVIDGDLRTDHRFFLAGIRFLTLYYTIDRVGSGPPPLPRREA